MQFQTFSGETMAEVMRKIRSEVGSEASIFNTRETKGGFEITVEMPQAEPTASEQFYARLWDCLMQHGVPSDIGAELINKACHHQTEKGSSPLEALATALEEVFHFGTASLIKRPPHKRKLITLVGTPGVGKTVTIAKLAAEHVFAQQPVHVITTDTLKAGAIAQLTTFTRALSLKLHVAATAEQLRAILAAIPVEEMVLVDTPGINPFIAQDMRLLGEIVIALQQPPVLVQAAGGDSQESEDIATAFHKLGATRLIVTRVDIAKRFGSVLSMAKAGPQQLCLYSKAPQIMHRLRTFTPKTLAKLLYDHAA